MLVVRGLVLKELAKKTKKLEAISTKMKIISKEVIIYLCIFYMIFQGKMG